LFSLGGDSGGNLANVQYKAIENWIPQVYPSKMKNKISKTILAQGKQTI
jgi:hypothetical protein